MSTAEFSNLNDGTTTVPTTYITGGSAKAWDYYDQSAVAIQQSFNISSVTDNSAGNADHNFTSALSDTTFPAQASQAQSSSEPGVYVKGDATTKTNVLTNSGSGLVDRRVNFTQFGDLA